MIEFNCRITEHPVENKRLGRHVLHDPRSKDFVAMQAKRLISVRHEAVGLPLDQGQIGSCTANALCGALNCLPDYKGHTLNEGDAVNLYELETRLEGEPYPPNDPGGSGLMVCKAGKQLGLLKSYRHAFGIDHALHALVLRPVIVGIDWYSSFDSPDANGVVKRSGFIRGGHEIVADQIDVDTQLVGFWNSWGSNWGRGGRFYMPFAVLDALLQNYGDVTVPYPA